MTGPGAGIVLRPLTSSDRDALATFTCANFAQPWTAIVEEKIRVHLADALAMGVVSGIGAWDGDTLCGVAAWRIEGELCESSVVAVAVGRRRAGIATALKKATCAEAAASGAVAVISFVHWDNDSMIELNVQLGASVERIPGDRDYCRCIIPT